MDEGAYPDDEPVTIGFAVALSAVRVASWWILWAATVWLGVYRRRTRTKGWTLYKIILAAISLACLRFTFYLAYAEAFERGQDAYATSVFNVYIFFANLSSSFFLVSETHRSIPEIRAPGPCCMTPYPWGPC
jgi:hypothetical protein